jgi:hypothetical protein
MIQAQVIDRSFSNVASNALLTYGRKVVCAFEASLTLFNVNKLAARGDAVG